MNKRAYSVSCLVLSLCVVQMPGNAENAPKPSTKAPYVVFLVGEQLYRSEQSMPMLAKILKRDFGFKVKVCYSLDSKTGTIDPGNTESISDIEELAKADLAVFFIRHRSLPDDQLKHIENYFDSGKPIVGFRTTSHPFKYAGTVTKDAKTGKSKTVPHKNDVWNRKKIEEVFGHAWLTDHGQSDELPRTAVTIYKGKGKHPILNGVRSFFSNSWLYHVSGGKDKMVGKNDRLLKGTSLASNKTKSNTIPLYSPVAWTHEHKSKSGKTARVFMTTLGHPYDFRQQSMRKLTINAVLWALGKEKTIPADGANTKYVGEYKHSPVGPLPKDHPKTKPEQL